MMEPLFLSLSLMLLTLVFFFYAYNSKPNSKHKLPLPPGSFGWPFIGETYDFLFTNPEKFIQQRMKKYSSKIFKTSLYGHPTVVLCGTSGHKFIASNEGKLFTAWRPVPIQKLFQFSHITPLTRQSEIHIIRAPVWISQEALLAYASTIDCITRDHFERHWFGRSQVEVYSLLKLLTVGIASKLFMGLEDPKLVAKMAKCFDHIVQGLNALPYDVPGTTFGQAKKSARAIRNEILKVIKEKKESLVKGGKPSDILSYLIIRTDPSGEFEGDDEVADAIMGLVTAGFNSPCTAMAFVMKYLGENPEVYQRINAEQVEIASSKRPEEPLSWNDIQRMKYSWNVLLEVMRLVPPLQGTFREAIVDFTYEGYTVPKGWKICWTVSSTNKDPKIFPEPERFDPSRFESEIPPFSNVPFGGGPRKCPGKDFARLQMLIYLHYAVRFFQWEVININSEVPTGMNPIPTEGVWVCLKMMDLSGKSN